MIKLIVGLGNPGRQYEKTRHNAGFLFLDALAAKFACSWIRESRFDGWMAECSIGSARLMLLKPETFMNRSGQSVGKVVRYYKLEPNDILVVHDELDFQAGVVKLKKNGGHGGHNGLRDIIAHLGTNEFYRLRIGIGRPDAAKQVVDYVLSAPGKKEWDMMLSAFEYSIGFVDQIVEGDVSAAMNKLNAQG